MASGNFSKSLGQHVEKSGGKQENLEIDFKREKLTLEEYRINWGDFVRDASDHIEQCGKDCEHSKERKMICRSHGDGWRIKLVRAGLVVPLGGHTDIIIPNKSDALSTLDMIANGFEDGDLDEELKSWMKKRDDNVAKAKAAKEKKDRARARRSERASSSDKKKLPSRPK